MAGSGSGTAQDRSGPRRWAGACARALLCGTLSSMVCLLAFGTVPLAWGWHGYTVVSGSMQPLVRRGDVVVAAPYHGERLRVGEVVVIDPPRRSATDPAGTTSAPITHRIVQRLPGGRYRTKGDANPAADSRLIEAADVRARARLVVPLLGRPALLSDRDLLIAGLGALLLLAGSLTWWRRPIAIGGLTLTLVAVPMFGDRGLTAALFTRTTSAVGTSYSSRSAFYAQAVIASGPVSYWRLGETAGTTGADQMGVAPLTLTGPPTRGRPSALFKDGNPAMGFTAASPVAYASTVTPAPAGLAIAGSVTVAAWLKTAVVAPSNARVVIKWSGTKLNYLMAWSSTGTDMRFLVENTGTTRSTAQAVYPTDHGWHFVVGVYDTAKVHLYIDGVEVNQVAATGTLFTSTDPVTVSAPTSGMNGDVDDVAIWSKALTGTEVSGLYSLGTS